MRFGSRFRILALTAALATALSACDLLNPTPVTPTPEPAPSSTLFVPGSDPTATSPDPTSTTAPAATDTAAPAATDTPAGATDTPAVPDEVGPEAVLILEPALPGVDVSSPVRVRGEADSTFEQNIVVQVFDQDGNSLAIQPTTIQAELGSRGPWEAEVAFSVSEDQPGRIAVWHASARDGGLVHLASVEVRLLASGGPVLAPGSEHPEDIAIFEPAHLAEVSGGSLTVAGYSMPVFENTLSLALCGEGGSGAPDLVCGTADNVIATGIAMVDAPDVGQPGPFEGELTYSVTGPVQARVVVYVTSARDGGITHLTSRPITLQP